MPYVGRSIVSSLEIIQHEFLDVSKSFSSEIIAIRNNNLQTLQSWQPKVNHPKVNPSDLLKAQMTMAEKDLIASLMQQKADRVNYDQPGA